MIMASLYLSQADIQGDFTLPYFLGLLCQYIGCLKGTEWKRGPGLLEVTEPEQ